VWITLWVDAFWVSSAVEVVLNAQLSKLAFSK